MNRDIPINALFSKVEAKLDLIVVEHFMNIILVQGFFKLVKDYSFKFSGTQNSQNSK